MEAGNFNQSAKHAKSSVFYSGVIGLVLASVVLVLTPLASKFFILYIFEPATPEIGADLVRVLYLSWAIALFSLFTLAYSRNVDRQLRSMEHLAEVGQTAAQVAHDLKTPLEAINVTLLGMRAAHSTEPTLSKWVPLLETSSQRLRGISSDLLGAYIMQPEKSVPIELHELLDQCITETRFARQSGEIKWIKNYAPGRIQFNGQRSQLGRAFLNLLTNAVQAITESGVITVMSQLTPNQICVQIQDTGKGMSDSQLEAFHAGTLTSSKIGGHGIGLNFVREVVTNHRGRLSVDSGPGGSTFTIELWRDEPPRPLMIRG